MSVRLDPVSFTSKMSLAFVLLLAVVLLSSPVRAAHTVVTAEVYRTVNCQDLSVSMDVSRGAPVILWTFSCDPGGGSPEAILFTRSTETTPNAGPSPKNRIGSSHGWFQTTQSIPGAGNLSDIENTTISPCPGNPGNCLATTFLVNTGSGYTIVTNINPLDATGLPLGDPTTQVIEVVWGGGDCPAFIGVTEEGYHLAGWTNNGLEYLPPGAAAPSQLAGTGEVAWPHGGCPPTSFGFYGEGDNPYVITTSSTNVHGFLLDGDTAPTPVISPFPEGTILTGDTTIQAGQGGTYPAGTVLPGDNVLVYYQDITRYVKRTSWGEGCDNPIWYGVSLKVPTKSGYTDYWLQDCGDYLLLTITKLDEDGNPVQLGEVVLYVDSGDWDLTGMKVDDDGNIHIQWQGSGTDPDGNIIDTVAWTRVILDDSKINWGTSILWQDNLDK